TAERRRSWKSRPGTPAVSHARSHGPRKSSMGCPVRWKTSFIEASPPNNRSRYPARVRDRINPPRPAPSGGVCSVRASRISTYRQLGRHRPTGLQIVSTQGLNSECELGARLVHRRTGRITKWDRANRLDINEGHRLKYSPLRTAHRPQDDAA